LNQAPRYVGLPLLLVSVIFWGILPIALKLSVDFVDATTLTWFRFVVALVITLALQWYLGHLKQFKNLVWSDWAWLLVAAGFSIGNYLTFAYCLEYLAPGPAQLYFQTAPFFLAFAGILVFKEQITMWQFGSLIVLAVGVILFFHPYLSLPESELDRLLLGILIVQVSSLCWSGYAVMQKYMKDRISGNNILLFIFVVGVVVMLPFSDLEQFADFKHWEWSVAGFCALNTLVAYGCFAQAMKYSTNLQTGAMVALVPIFSFLFTFVVAILGWWPDVIQADQLDQWQVIGIVTVVASVILLQIPKRELIRILKSAIRRSRKELHSGL